MITTHFYFPLSNIQSQKGGYFIFIFCYIGINKFKTITKMNTVKMRFLFEKMLNEETVTLTEKGKEEYKEYIGENPTELIVNSIDVGQEIGVIERNGIADVAYLGLHCFEIK